MEIKFIIESLEENLIDLIDQGLFHNLEDHDVFLESLEYNKINQCYDITLIGTKNDILSYLESIGIDEDNLEYFLELNDL